MFGLLYLTPIAAVGIAGEGPTAAVGPTPKSAAIPTAAVRECNFKQKITLPL